MAHSLSQVYVKTFASILDWSCISQDSYVFKTIIRNDRSLRAQLEYLSIICKNSSFLLKDEANNKLLRSIVASSAKQYIVQTHSSDLEYPILSPLSSTLAKKCKGLPRSRHPDVSYSDFSNIAIRNKPARKYTVNTASLKRQNYNIFLLKGTKKKLSKYSVKRLYSERYKRNLSFFSFPLNWRQIIQHWSYFMFHILFSILY